MRRLAARLWPERWVLVAVGYIAWVQTLPDDGTRREFAVAGLVAVGVAMALNIYLELVGALTEWAARRLGWPTS